MVKVTAVVGTLACLMALLTPLTHNGNLWKMLTFSFVMNMYSWSAATFLTAGAAMSAYRGHAYGNIILAGITVFDCALIMDRLLPKFEPIRFGWFTEIAGAVIVLSFGAVLVRETVRQSRERLVLEGRIDSMADLIDLQRHYYYPMVLESIQTARTVRHDLRHHMRLIRELAAEGNLSGLTEYLKGYHADSNVVHPLSYTENYVVDTLLRHFAALCESGQIPFDVQADLSEHLNIPDGELAIVLSNLLENALEACACIPTEDAYIKISLRCWRSQLCIVEKNSFDGNLRERNGLLLPAQASG